MTNEGLDENQLEILIIQELGYARIRRRFSGVKAAY